MAIKRWGDRLRRLVLGAVLGQALGLQGAPEAFEVGPDEAAALPGGKEADGIVGDFVLRNDRLEAVISGNQPGRKANMSTYAGVTSPGCLYDLTRRGAQNDQLTIFSPAGQMGPVSYVRVVADGTGGEAVIETVASAAPNQGILTRHEYCLRDGWQGLRIRTTLQNQGAQPRRVSLRDRWTAFLDTGEFLGITWADAVDPSDRAGYAYAWLAEEGRPSPPEAVDLAPGEQVTLDRFLAVGSSPAEAVGVVAAFRGPTGVVSGQVRTTAGQPVSGARVDFLVSTNRLPAYPDLHGYFVVRLPPGRYEIEASEIGRPSVKQGVEVAAEARAERWLTMEAASGVDFDVRDEGGRSLPCKVQFRSVGTTVVPSLGPAIRAHGCVDQYHSESGVFRVQLPPGQYGVIVTRGIEYSHWSQGVNLAAGQFVSVKAVLRRLVDTRGWVSADFHSHSTPSGDNTCGTEDRLINLAAEHIEFAPATEHNRFYDWEPHLAKLGLAQEIRTVPGIEFTGPGAHLNAFPFEPEPELQDGGAPIWQRDARVNALVLREHQRREPDRWVQLNHPDLVGNFVDRDHDGQADGGLVGLGQFIDGLETQNGLEANILARAPIRIGRDRQGREFVGYVDEFVWLQLLNCGQVYWGVTASDAHAVYGDGVGGWRTYLPSSTDLPGQIDWREITRQAKAGRMVLTTGPFLEVRAADGTGPGGLIRGLREVTLQVRVQCTDWVEIDRVQVLVNGRQPAELNFTRASHPDRFRAGVVRFEQSIPVRLERDAHLIVVACGEREDLTIGYGTSPQWQLKPCAYHNPILVDVDADGFQANGDRLGWPLPLRRLKVDEAKAMLEARSP